MKSIRTGVFETNSSSTHSICITKNRRCNMCLPQKLYFSCGDFGWEYKTLKTPEEKASYLYSSILCIYDKETAEGKKSLLWDMLGAEGVECEFETPIYYGASSWCENASVDHAGTDDHSAFVERVLSNVGRLLRYLFSEESFVITGNDNGYFDMDIAVNYPHEEYYKGN